MFFTHWQVIVVARPAYHQVQSSNVSNASTGSLRCKTDEHAMAILVGTFRLEQMAFSPVKTPEPRDPTEGRDRTSGISLSFRLIRGLVVYGLHMSFHFWCLARLAEWRERSQLWWLLVARPAIGVALLPKCSGRIASPRRMYR